MGAAQAAAQHGLQIVDLVQGSGRAATKGDTVRVQYIGTLENGTKFDASRDHGTEGFTFARGQGHVIRGWDEGVVGMKVGGKRKLTIPPSLGYRSTAKDPIPADSTLIFEIEMLEIKTKPSP